MDTHRPSWPARTVSRVAATRPATDRAARSEGTGSPAAPSHLAVNGVVDPLGIDDTTPDLRWRAPAGSERQTAFEVRVASSADRLPRPDLWRSGKVESSAQSVTYAGAALGSRDRGVWQVRVWGTTGGPSPWSGPGRFELGLLEESDWQGAWIGDPRWNRPLHQDVSLGEREARYVRLRVVELGRPGVPLGGPDAKPRLELGEVEVVHSSDEGHNLAAGASVTVSEASREPGVWQPEFLTDGKVTTATAPRGYRSDDHEETDVRDRPIVITLDLGTTVTLDTVRLFPLWDSPGPFGTTPNFPREVQVSVSQDGTTFSDAAGPVTFAAVSRVHEAPDALPVLARDLTTTGPVARARLYVTGLGVHQTTLNGAPVSQDLLEPANTQHRVRVPYATYDVTAQLRDGLNTWGIELGNGIWNVFNTPGAPGRFIKAPCGHGAPRALGQLEITYQDGRRVVVATDESWDSTLGEVTFSSWYGGEDHDARRSLGGWNVPGADRGDWQDALVMSPPHGGAALVARENPPIRHVDTLRTVAVTEPEPGVHVFDLGVNVAGWQELTTSGPAGTTIVMRRGESLHPDGTVDQRSAGGDVWDTFVLTGAGQETFRPKFVYHGFRYLQVEGLATPPTPETVTGLVLRAANEAVGSFTTSDAMMRDVHRIVDRSVQSNMYSVLTDCPHREKLGWLDQTHLVFDTVAFGYDVQAHYRKLLQDVVDAQQDDGMIPTTAPDETWFPGAFRHDACWGATLAVSSWQLYRWYGDDSAMRQHWPRMVAYHDHLSRRAANGVLDGGLGDWITPADPATPPAVTQTWALHRITTHMARIAEALGDDATAAAYREEAERIAKAFHRELFDPATGLYGNGDQASQALALEGGMVPADLRAHVLERFVQLVRDADDHVEVGEVGLYAAVELLSRERRHDVLHDWVQRTDGVSYGAMLRRGATSLPESWTSPHASQNHYMLGAIGAWFVAGVAGISQAEGSVGWQDVVIEPALVGDVASASASYESVRGVVSSSWARDEDGTTLTVEVPGNTRGVVRVPLGQDGTVSAPEGAARVPSDVAGFAQFEVGAGQFTFTAGPAPD